MVVELKRIKQLINNGENSYIEFKIEATRPESIAKELVAFLNFEGGSLYIGVSDNGKIIGVNLDEDLEEWIMNICRNSINPPVIPIYEEIRIDNKNKLIKISVNKGTNKPYSLVNNNKYYIRVGSTSREASQEELIRLLQESNYLHYEITPILASSINDLNKVKIQDYFEKREIDILDYNDKEYQNLLINTEIMVEINNKKSMSYAGALFFAKNIRKWVKNAGVQLVRFEGNNVTGLVIDKKDIEGNIPDIIDKSVDFVNLHNKISEKFEGIKRIDVADYNKQVIREIIINAFAHRDWSLYGAKVRVYIFDDYIEIRSPGKIPNTLTLERIKMGISYYRNPLITQMLADYGYADKIGRGIMRIIKYHKEHKLKAPEFKEVGFEFMVRIWKS